MQKTLEASESNCGFIPDKSTANQSYKVNVKYLVEIREERIVKMIQKEISETEGNWLRYGDEKIECMLQLSDNILKSLIEDTAETLLALASRSL